MSADTAPGYRDQTRPPPWRDVRVLRVVFQALFLAAVAWFLWYLWGNLTRNLAEIGQAIGFDFLRQPAGFTIRESDFRPGQPVRDAIVVGFVNTAQVAFLGIALASVLGLLIGVARLSTNWLVSKAGALYVETVRNIPVLLIIVFFYSAVFLRLPPISEAIEWFNVVVFSNRGLVVPYADADPGATRFLIVAGVGLLLAVGVGAWRTRKFNAEGTPHHRMLWGAGVLLAVLLLAWLALGRPLTGSFPVREGRVVTGGIGLGTEYSGLLIGLVVYTASHIAEIVRGSVLAVPKGQSEAASAIALSGFQRMRYVILPQALRIMVPPLANQYLNLTKNSSLAVFIGYPELTRIIGTVIGNGNPAPPAIAILMAGYLVFSLGISLIANVVNRSLALEGR